MNVRGRNVNVRGRLWVVGGVLALAAVLLVGRAAWMQLRNRDFYQQQGDVRYLRELPIAASRGMILDRNGEALAASPPVASIAANPQVSLKYPDQLPALAQALSADVRTLTAKLAQRADRQFAYLRRHLSPDAAAAIVALKIPGVSAHREFRRFYPQGEVMAQVLGTTNVDDAGRSGLELAFDDWLKGVPGAKRVIRDNIGRLVEDVDLLRAARPGNDLVLSIDRRVQYVAFRELRAALSETEADAGTLVMIDVHNGEIIAMVNLPSYNPNPQYRAGAPRRSDRAFHNSAVVDAFEPGSTMKAFTAVAALESGKFTPDTVLDTAPGYLAVGGGYVAHDFKNYGRLTLTEVLVKSSNVGAIKVADQLSAQQQFDAYRRFGLGQLTGSGFPLESAGVLRPVADWKPVDKRTIAYGYSLMTSALQLARAYAAFGNGGMLVTPTFVKGNRAEPVRIIEPKIAAQLLTMLEAVTGPAGTAKQASIPGYRVAGKTGTSRKASDGVYNDTHHIAVFVGLAPASAPRYAMTVVIDNSKGEEYGGGDIAAPVFSRAMGGALRLLDVAPDRIDAWYAQASLGHAADDAASAQRPRHGGAQ